MAPVSVQIDKQAGIAVLLTSAYLVMFAIAGGKQAFLGVMVYLVLPWLLLTNPEALGAFSYGNPAMKYMSVNRPTPANAVTILGWIFMIAPGVYFIVVYA